MNFEKIINVALLKAAFARYHAALLALFPQRKRVNITIPYGVTEYVYSDAWITTDTDCYGHDMALHPEIGTTVSWVFADGSVTFTLGSALVESATIKFGMIKGQVSS